MNTISNTLVQDQMIELHNWILFDSYYADLYMEVLRQNRMTGDGIFNSLYDDVTIIKMANVFWDSLPESPAIRKGPFFLLCNICENIFQ